MLRTFVLASLAIVLCGADAGARKSADMAVPTSGGFGIIDTDNWFLQVAGLSEARPSQLGWSGFAPTVDYSDASDSED